MCLPEVFTTPNQVPPPDCSSVSPFSFTAFQVLYRSVSDSGSWCCARGARILCDGVSPSVQLMWSMCSVWPAYSIVQIHELHVVVRLDVFNFNARIWDLTRSMTRAWRPFDCDSLTNWRTFAYILRLNEILNLNFRGVGLDVLRRSLEFFSHLPLFSPPS